MISCRTTPTLAIRPCPLCGVAMQASKSREGLENFDTFRCLACQTTIIKAPTAAAAAPPAIQQAQMK